MGALAVLGRAPPAYMSRPVPGATAQSTASEGRGGAEREKVTLAHAPPPLAGVFRSSARGPV